MVQPRLNDMTARRDGGCRSCRFDDRRRDPELRGRLIVAHCGGKAAAVRGADQKPTLANGRFWFEGFTPNRAYFRRT